jgi:hypothetical protein
MKAWLMALLAVAGAPLAMQASPAWAVEREARCVVTSRDEPTWRGPCIFSPGRRGSFTLSAVDYRSREGTINGMSDFSLEIISPGVGRAEYMMWGLGRHEDGGILRRSRRDPACWVGRDYSICVY